MTHVLHTDVPIAHATTWAGEAQRRGCSHQRDVRHTGQDNLAHDAVICIHPDLSSGKTAMKRWQNHGK